MYTLIILISIIILLFSNSVTFREDKAVLYNRLTLIALIISSFLLLNSLNLNGLAQGIALFGGLFQANLITHSFQLFLIIISYIIIHLTAFYHRSIYFTHIKPNSFTKNSKYFKIDGIIDTITNKRSEEFKIIEYPLILLFIISGAIFLMSSNDLISTFISIELQSYGLYLLSTLYRNSELATNAGLTYFILGGLSSCFILLGISLLYANSGTTSLEGIYVITSINDFNDTIFKFSNSYNTINYLNIAFIFISVGFLFKVSAAPFHFWAPNVYDAVPTIVTTFIAIVAKISLLIFLLEIVSNTATTYNSEYSWNNTLLLSTLFSLIIGTVLGLTQSRIKRLYTYSTISHLGFILMALSINSIESIQAFIFYLIQYSLTNLNAFFILLSMGYFLSYATRSEYKNLPDINYSTIQLISQIRGFFYLNPILSLSLAITVFSFAGIPPLLGFFAKQMVLVSAINKGYIFLSFIAILTSVISGVYYLNLVKEMFFYMPGEKDSRDEEDSTKDNSTKEDSTKINSINKKSRNKAKDLIPQELLDSIKVDYKITFKGLILDVDNVIAKVTLAGYLSIIISILTLLITLFIFSPSEYLNITKILSYIFNIF